MTNQHNAVCYYRVSTTKQGISGLGLESQREIAESYCKANGLTVIKYYREVFSGGKNDREELAEALRLCRLTKSTLVVAKLDRISRDVGFIDALQKSNARFVCADMPEANESMIQFMSVFAQYERKMASERTKAALAAKKARGEKLGSPSIREVQKLVPTSASVKGNSVKSERAQRWSEDVYKEIEVARAEGFTTLASIAAWLNDHHIKTSRGNSFTPTAVKRVIARCNDF